jgi:hypothetical protein
MTIYSCLRNYIVKPFFLRPSPQYSTFTQLGSPSSVIRPLPSFFRLPPSFILKTPSTFGVRPSISASPPPPQLDSVPRTKHHELRTRNQQSTDIADLPQISFLTYSKNKERRTKHYELRTGNRPLPSDLCS